MIDKRRPALILMLILALHVQAQDLDLTPREERWIDDNPVLRVAGPRAFPPFYFHDETGEAQGMAADYMRLVAARLGLELEVHADLPWPEVLEGAQGGSIDVISCVAWTADRERYLDFSDPILSFPLVIFTRTDGDFVGGLEDLRGIRVASARGISTLDWLSRDGIDIEPVLVDSPLDALRAVSLGDAEAYIGNLAASTYLIDSHGLANLKAAAPTPYGDYDLHMAVRNDLPELVAIIDKALRSITPQEQVEIRSKWLSVRYEHGIRARDVVTSVAIAIASALVLLSLTLLWNRQLQKEIGIRTAAQQDNERLIQELRDALAQVTTLEGLLPICSYCKKIRDDRGYWSQIEQYLRKHTGASFSHGLCPDCMEKHHPEASDHTRRDTSEAAHRG